MRLRTRRTNNDKWVSYVNVYQKEFGGSDLRAPSGANEKNQALKKEGTLKSKLGALI
jgi:hypothetical protein